MAISYPYDKTVFPLGLASPLVMWTAPNATDVYKIHLEENGYQSDTYAIPTKSGQLRVAQATWDRLTASNTGDAVKATLSRYDVASKTAYASANESWTIALASLRGAIYYWTTSSGGHMSRIRPGTGAVPEQINGGTCMGCHAVSADGTTLVAAVENEGATDNADQRGWVSYDLPDASIRKEPKLFGGNVAVNPNGKYTVFGTGPLKIADTKTGTETPVNGLESFTLDPGMVTLAHPAFSPDGKKFAAVESNNNWFTWTTSKLVLFSFDETMVKFTGATPLAASAAFGAGQQAIAYPSFSPDSAFIAFHVGDHASGCSGSCDNAETGISAIYLQSTAGTAAVRLAQLTDSPPNVADRNLSFEPTFNPIERGGYFWVVFTSMRDWGNEITGTANNGKKRLWVAAIDKAAGTLDPSHPAFFLEGQEETTTNMRGFWALAACTQTPVSGTGGSCAAGFECCSGFCDKGVCVDTGKLACAQQGDSCKVSADCCNSPLVTCTNGSCQASGPK
jgi:WD40 repeat protein